jgi:alkaline phosphatase
VRRTTRRIILTSTLVGTLVLGAGASFAVTSSLTGHGDAARHAGDTTAAVLQQIKKGPARNVILLIGDGMGDSEITAARNYQYGADGRLPGIDALPLTGSYTTFSLDKTNGKPDYDPDSAATGTGWSTGTKSYDGAISVDVDGQPQATLLELAKKAGLRTGDVTTAEIQDATPAVQVAHVLQRSCYSPSKMAGCDANKIENGGLGSITEQVLNTRPDLIIGGGASSFADTATAGRWAGKTLQQQASERGFQYVTTAGALDAVTKADQRTPLIAVFNAGNLPTEWTGPAASRAGGAEAPVRCTANPAHDGVPTLRATTTKAISLLDDKHSRTGFFLQVEGASIDKQDHAANPCAQIGENLDFDAAVKVALDFAKKDKNTLVIVTADHGHTSQIVEAGSTTPGLTRTLLTTEGQPMTIAYGTAEAGGSQQHTGTQVRVAAYGPAAANVVGLTDQTDTFFTIKDALQLDRKPGSHGGFPGWGWFHGPWH